MNGFLTISVTRIILRQFLCVAHCKIHGTGVYSPGSNKRLYWITLAIQTLYFAKWSSLCNIHRYVHYDIHVNARKLTEIVSSSSIVFQRTLAQLFTLNTLTSFTTVPGRVHGPETHNSVFASKFPSTSQYCPESLLLAHRRPTKMF